MQGKFTFENCENHCLQHSALSKAKILSLHPGAFTHNTACGPVIVACTKQV